MNKHKREYMAHYIDVNFSYNPQNPESMTTPLWYRIGEDLEEYNVEMNPRVEVEQNFLGDDIVVYNGYEVVGEAAPFYAYRGDSLFFYLQTVVNHLYEGTYCFTCVLDVHLFNKISGSGDNSAYKAFMRPCYVVPDSYGGDTTGYQIPFTVYYLNNFITEGTFKPNGDGSGTFQAD